MTIPIFLQAAVPNTNAAQLLKAAQQLVGTAQPTCSTIIFIGLVLHVGYSAFRVAVFHEQFNGTNLLRLLALFIFVATYNEVMGVVMGGLNSVANVFPANHDILATLKKFSEGDYGQSHQTHVSLLNIDIPYDNFESFLVWLM